MNNRLFLGAYWPPRQESLEQCADRLAWFFAELSSCDPGLGTWYETGWSRKEPAQHPVNTSSRECLLNILDRGRNRRDSDRRVIEDLGFHVDVWNGDGKRRAAGLRVNCGLYWVSPSAAAGLANCVTLDLPQDLGELREPGRMVRVLAAVAEGWEPDWGGVMSREAMEMRGFRAGVPFVDWMLYLSRKVHPEIGSLPLPSRVQEVDGLGSIIVVQDEPPHHANPEHLRNIKRVEAALKEGVGSGRDL